MSKRTAGIDEQLARLVALRDDPKSPDARQLLSKALAGRSNLAAGKAADIVREQRILDLVPDLVRAFNRFIPDGADKGCVAKTAIAQTLDTLEQNEQDVFLRGVRHVQPEGTWGGSTDVAAELRGICAAGLARTNYWDVIWELANLLADDDAGARAAAARAIAHTGRDEGAALLRMKIRTGDPEPAVIGECFLALLRLSPAKGVPVVTAYLDDPATHDELRGAATMSLAESRLPVAFELFRERYEREPSVARRLPLLLPMALTRRPEAVEFLIGLVENERPATASQAVAALSTYRHDASIRARLQQLVTARAEPAIDAIFAKQFRQS